MSEHKVVAVVPEHETEGESEDDPVIALTRKYDDKVLDSIQRYTKGVQIVLYYVNTATMPHTLYEDGFKLYTSEGEKKAVLQQLPEVLRGYPHVLTMAQSVEAAFKHKNRNKTKSFVVIFSVIVEGKPGDEGKSAVGGLIGEVQVSVQSDTRVVKD